MVVGTNLPSKVFDWDVDEITIF